MLLVVDTRFQVYGGRDFTFIQPFVASAPLACVASPEI
jgi:hypothetical protein